MRLKLSQNLSPQQIQLMNLIQLSTVEFEQKVKQEIEENIALDETSAPDDLRESLDELAESERREEEDLELDAYMQEEPLPVAAPLEPSVGGGMPEPYLSPEVSEDLYRHLSAQLYAFELSEKTEAIAAFIIGSLDENGYLTLPLEELCDELAFNQNIETTLEEIEQTLKEVIHRMDPYGVGARTLQECIGIQLRQLDNAEWPLKIISESFDLFSKKHYDKIARKYHLSDEQLKAALSTIEHMNPKPGSGFSGMANTSLHVIPDFIVQWENNKFSIELNAKNAPQLNISNKYMDMMDSYKNSKSKTTEQRQAVSFIKQKLDAARWFIDAVSQRHRTLMLTMQAIVEYQKAYFLTGDEQKLRPMALRHIGELVGLDVSTVSRVVNSKYALTPFGVKRLKDFFSEGIKQEHGEDISNIKVKKVLEELIRAEDKRNPLTDEQLVEALKSRQIPIARRTVAKYRDMLNLPTARLRREL